MVGSKHISHIVTVLWLFLLLCKLNITRGRLQATGRSRKGKIRNPQLPLMYRVCECVCEWLGTRCVCDWVNVTGSVIENTKALYNHVSPFTIYKDKSTHNKYTVTHGLCCLSSPSAK